MANRFTDSRKWDDPWFRKLPCKYKALWLFLLDKCDHAGIWKVDYESASFHIGEVVGEEARAIMNGRIYEYKDKWFIPKFIFFQYGFLSDINRVHKSVVEILEKEGLYKVYKQTLIGLKDKDYDKDKDKDKDNINNDTNHDKDKMIKWFDEAWSSYPSKVGKKEALKHFNTSVKTEQDFVNIKIAIENYKKSERVKKGFIQNGSTFFNDWTGWVSQVKEDPLAKYEVRK